MKIEADESVVWIVIWLVIGACVLALIGMCWFAVDRYDKRVKLAVQMGYAIDTKTESSYQPQQK